VGDRTIHHPLFSMCLERTLSQELVRGKEGLVDIDGDGRCMISRANLSRDGA
jgi:hypothetical protein